MSIPILKIPFTGEYIVQGDTIDKTSFQFIEEGINIATSTVKMQIYDGAIKIIDIVNGSGITIIDSNNFEIDQVIATNNNLPVGCFQGDLEITTASGVRFTYMRVQYNILKQYTK